MPSAQTHVMWIQGCGTGAQLLLELLQDVRWRLKDVHSPPTQTQRSLINASAPQVAENLISVSPSCLVSALQRCYVSAGRLSDGWRRALAGGAGAGEAESLGDKDSEVMGFL